MIEAYETWQPTQRDRKLETEQQAHRDRRQHKKRSQSQWRKNRRQPAIVREAMTRD
jgi:hypothetical protein